MLKYTMKSFENEIKKMMALKRTNGQFQHFQGHKFIFPFHDFLVPVVVELKNPDNEIKIMALKVLKMAISPEKVLKGC